MAGFHFSEDGQKRPCNADKRPCPLRNEGAFDGLHIADEQLAEDLSSAYLTELHGEFGSTSRSIEDLFSSGDLFSPGGSSLFPEERAELRAL